jgi:signal transduction histidine kinase
VAISDIVRAVKTYAYLDQAPVQEVDLRASLEDTLVILKHQLREGVTVRREFAPDLPRIEAYASELNQVWTNLIANAVQAMGGKGTLELKAARAGDYVEVTVTDDGPGIDPALGARIFDPFFTTKAPGEGSGLGLHIAYNIVVNKHGGRIEYESRPGRTSFRITLPAVRLRREAA